MANLFDPANSPTTEPQTIVVGDFIQWRRTNLQDYDNSLYTMAYVVRVTDGGTSQFQVNGSAYGSDYLFSVSSTTSASYAAGDYFWQLEAIRNADSERIVIERGGFKVVGDLDISGADTRSHAQIMVGKIESLLNGKADSDVANYEIAGRKLTKLSFKELIDARDYYRGQIALEQRALNIKQGKATNGTVKVRF